MEEQLKARLAAESLVKNLGVSKTLREVAIHIATNAYLKGVTDTYSKLNQEEET